jgi:hypothetical protein
MAVELASLRSLTQAILGLNYGHHEKNRLSGFKIAKACSAATGLTSECKDTEYHPERQGDFQRRSLPTIGMILDFFGNHPSNFTIVVNLPRSKAQIPRESSPPLPKIGTGQMA